MPLFYCAIPDNSLETDMSRGISGKFGNHRYLHPIKWITENGKVRISLTFSIANKNISLMLQNKPLNKLAFYLMQKVGRIESYSQSDFNQYFNRILTDANIYCLDIPEYHYKRLMNMSEATFFLDPGSFEIVGFYSVPATGRISDNRGKVTFNSLAPQILKDAFLKECREARTEFNVSDITISEESFTLDNKPFPKLSLDNFGHLRHSVLVSQSTPLLQHNFSKDGNDCCIQCKIL